MNSVSVSTREFVEETEGRWTCLTLVSSTLTLSFPTSSPQGVTMKQSRGVMGEHHSSDVKGSVSMSTTACQIWKYNKSVFGHLLCECAHTHMHTHTRIPVHIFLCVQVCVCVCVYVCTPMEADVNFRCCYSETLHLLFETGRSLIGPGAH